MFSAICGICGPRGRPSIFGKSADPVLENQDIFGSEGPHPAAKGLNEERLRRDAAATAPPPEPYFAAGGEVDERGTNYQTDEPILPAFDERYPMRQASFGTESHDSIDTEYEEDVAKCRAELVHQLHKENGKFQEQANNLSSLTRAMSRAIEDNNEEENQQQTKDVEKKLQELEQSKEMSKHMDVLVDQFKGSAPKSLCHTASGAVVKVPEPPRPSRSARKGKKPKLIELPEDEEGGELSRGDEVDLDDDPVERSYQGIQEKLRTIGKIVKVDGPVPRADASSLGKFQAEVSRQMVREELLETADKYRDVMEGKFQRLGFNQDDIEEDLVDPADPAKAVKSAIAQYQQVSLKHGMFYPMPGNTSGDGLSDKQEREIRSSMHQLREDRPSDVVFRRSSPEESRRAKRPGAPEDVSDPSSSKPRPVAQSNSNVTMESLLGGGRHSGNADLVGI